jgi:hypothetical protein
MREEREMCDLDLNWNSADNERKKREGPKVSLAGSGL